MELNDLPANIKVMVVTKGRTIGEILNVLGKTHFTLIGESRWQEAKDKLPQLPSHIEKHFIGHVQTNKAKEIVEHFDYIESVDSLKLARMIDKVAQDQGKIMPILLQVNISRDPHKYGFFPEQLAKVIQQLKQCQFLDVRGLMTITAKQSPENTKHDFERMKQLQTNLNLPELSMGMSDDWQLAVVAGATIIRLGRILFQ